jgi:hypothetical protein
MIISGIPFASIEIPTLESFLREQVPESRTHDYKSMLPHSKDDEAKGRLLRSISAFANTAGGVIIFGVDSESAPDWRLKGLENFDEDRDVAALSQLIASGIQPKLSAVRLRVLRRDGSPPILMLGISRSLAAPHRVSDKYKGGFHRRDERGNREMDVYELREAFEEGERWMRSAEEFRTARVLSLPSNTQLPHVNVAFGLSVLHIVPLGRSAASIDAEVVSPRWTEQFMPLPAVGNPWIVRPTLDGWLSWAPGDNMSQHTLIFRNGAIEIGHSIYPWLINRDQNPPSHLELQGGQIERHYVRSAQRAFPWLVNAGVSPPYAIFATLLGVRGKQLIGPAEMIDPPPTGFDRAEIAISPIILEEAPLDVVAAFRPLFDAIWQSASWNSSPYFRPDGTWKLALN